MKPQTLVIHVVLNKSEVVDARNSERFILIKPESRDVAEITDLTAAMQRAKPSPKFLCCASMGQPLPPFSMAVCQDKPSQDGLAHHASSCNQKLE